MTPPTTAPNRRDTLNTRTVMSRSGLYPAPPWQGSLTAPDEVRAILEHLALPTRPAQAGPGTSTTPELMVYLRRTSTLSFTPTRKTVR